MELQYNFQNVVDGQGISIAITGMLIVFSALVLISSFIAVLPRALAAISHRFPEPPDPAPAGDTTADPAVVAAIGIALHQRGGTAPGRGSS